MKDISEHIKDTAKKAVVTETEKEQASARQRLAEVMSHMLKHEAQTGGTPYDVDAVLQRALEATGLLLDEEGPVGTIRMNVDVDMYVAPRNLDEELDRLAERYGTEYLAEYLIDYPSHVTGKHQRREPYTGRHEVSYVERTIAERRGVEAVANLKAACPTEDLVTGEPTLPEACVVDVLQRYLYAGEYFNPEIGASPTLELAIADAVTYIKELMDLRKLLAAREDDLK